MARLRSYIETICSALSGVGTAILAGIALWGVFFTTIPEILIRQLRADISDTQEQLTDLRQERRKLVTDNKAAKSELFTTTQERNKLVEQLNVLRQEKKQSEEELANVRMERKAYFQNVVRSVLSTFFASIRGDMDKLQQIVFLAKEYDAMRAWIRKGDQLDKEKPDAITREWWTKFSEWQSEMPPHWSGDVLLESLRGGEFGSPTKIDAPEGNPSERVVSQFEESVTRSDGKRMTGFDIVTKNLELNGFDQLLPTDRDQITRTVKAFLDEHGEAFASPLDIRLSTGWKARDLTVAADEAHNAQERIVYLLVALQELLMSAEQ